MIITHFLSIPDQNLGLGHGEMNWAPNMGIVALRAPVGSLGHGPWFVGQLPTTLQNKLQIKYRRLATHKSILDNVM